MKVVVSGLRGIPGVMGGVETHCEELYKRLPSDFDVTVYGRKGYCESAKLSDTLSVKAIYSPRKQSLETPLHTLFTILHCFLFQKVDVFHIHGIGASIFLPLAKLLFPRVVVTHHSQNYEHQKWGRLARSVFRLGEKFALKQADMVLFVSKTLLRDSKERFPDRVGRYHFMANGFSLPTQEEVVEGVEQPYFLAVGRLVPEKGFHDLVDAFSRYTGPEKLLIAGASDFKNSYTESIKSKANEKVVFLGKKSRAELKWLYSNCEAFVMPSYSEGLPISALEAVYCGSPLILSDIVQNKDLSFPDKCYFPLGDVTSLINKLAEGGEVVEKDKLSQFDWEKIAVQYVDLLKRKEN
ncbi:hypothetical protein NM09_03960 [Vibrio caribbeanicus]|uniref:Uncharacterized protein n=1 Tax=Vibrio caribbeanicus TaxID=701175 RepID=A0ACC4P0P6_9VIBR|nr:hypothetical protein NM09_03960 [Vibrio caribbeanicus]